MKPLNQYFEESLMNEAVTSQWKIWGKLSPDLLKKFQRELTKFDVVEDMSDYEDGTFTTNMSPKPGYYIDLTINSDFRKIEKFADKYYLQFSGNTPESTEYYRDFVKAYRK
jgi:hypothetical protein